MSRRYDSRTTMFSPEGRLFQVEYAMEAISHAGTAVGILSCDGIVLAAERKMVNSLLEPDQPSQDKIYKIDNHLITAVAGITSDANILVKQSRQIAQDHLYTFQENIPVEMLIQKICNMKQRYTHFGGLRPFGVSLIYAGYDKHFGWQLYQSDPSGNYGGWKATVMGSNSAAAQSILKSDYSDGCNMSEALLLAVKVLKRTMEGLVMKHENIELMVLSKDENGKLNTRTLSKAEVEPLIKQIQEKEDASQTESNPTTTSTVRAEPLFSTTVS